MHPPSSNGHDNRLALAVEVYCPSSVEEKLFMARAQELRMREHDCRSVWCYTRNERNEVVVHWFITNLSKEALLELVFKHYESLGVPRENLVAIDEYAIYAVSKLMKYADLLQSEDD